MVFVVVVGDGGAFRCGGIRLRVLRWAVGWVTRFSGGWYNISLVAGRFVCACGFG